MESKLIHFPEPKTINFDGFEMVRGEHGIYWNYETEDVIWGITRPDSEGLPPGVKYYPDWSMKCIYIKDPDGNIYGYAWDEFMHFWDDFNKEEKENSIYWLVEFHGFTPEQKEEALMLRNCAGLFGVSAYEELGKWLECPFYQLCREELIEVWNSSEGDEFHNFANGWKWDNKTQNILPDTKDYLR